MTPERQNCWNSLSQEEKRVRRDIADFKTAIKNCKASLNDSTGYSLIEKCSIRYHKKSIRALRRQIAMRPFRKEFGLFCPTCKDCLGVGWLHIVKTPHCSKCGQKLRW